MTLEIVVDRRMVVALGALHVAAQENPADVAGHHIDVEIAIEHELGRRPQLRIGAVGRENLADQLIEWLIVQKRQPQILVPFF